MAIAAAGSSSRPVRRSSRRPLTLVLTAVAVLAIVAGVVAVVRSAAHDHSGIANARAVAPRPTRASHGSASAAAAHNAHAARAATDPFTPALRHWLAGRGSDITAAVEDLQGGRIWLYRPGHPEHTASIVKVDILATLLHERQGDGGLSSADQQLATGMIESSDDDDASDLFQSEGGAGAVQAFDRSIGMTQTTVNAAWGLTSTTPQDQLKLLHAVLFKGPLTPASSRYEVGLMTHIVAFDTWGVTAGPEHHATIAFKNGWLPDPSLWQVNSIGSVRGEGRHYLIAVMTRDNPTEADGIATIEHVSQAAWKDLDGIADR